MSATKIGWTDLTLSPVIGCTHAAYEQPDGKKVAHPGCVNCYAEKMCSRKLPGFSGHNKCSSKGKWTGELQILHERLAWPFTRKEYKPRRDGKQRRCFLTSLSDMGHPGLAEADWMAVQGMMLLSPWIIWQDLTKRPDRQSMLLRKYTPAQCVEALCRSNAIVARHAPPYELWHGFSGHRTWDSFPHIHRYVSVSDQATADALIPELLKMPCAVRGVSLEPMVGPVDIERFMRPSWGDLTPRNTRPLMPYLNHIIVGGESGRGAGIRPFALEWALDVIEQCKRAGMWCFVKQMGSRPYIENVKRWDWKHLGWNFHDPSWLPSGLECGAAPCLTGKGDNPLEWPEVLRVQQNVGNV